MAELRTDLIESSGLSEGADGIQLTRSFIVPEMGEGSKAARLYRVLQHPGVPRYGDPHPDVPGVTASSIQIEPASQKTFRVLVTYSAPDPTAEVDGPIREIEMGTTLTTEETSRDKDGSLMVIQVYYENLDDDGNVTERGYKPYVGRVQVQRPLQTYRVRRRLSSPPTQHARSFVGKVGGFGTRSGKWFCARIEFDSQDGGESYDVLYEFQYNERGWEADVEFVNAQTGAPDEGSVSAKFPVYQTADFTQLGIPAPPGWE